jgi:hypothetical protein
VDRSPVGVRHEEQRTSLISSDHRVRARMG